MARRQVHIGSHWWQSCCVPNALFWIQTLNTNLTRSLGAGVAHPAHPKPGFAIFVGNGDNLPGPQLALNACKQGSLPTDVARRDDLEESTSTAIDPCNSNLQSCMHAGLSAFSQYRTSSPATCVDGSEVWRNHPSRASETGRKRFWIGPGTFHKRRCFWCAKSLIRLCKRLI